MNDLENQTTSMAPTVTDSLGSYIVEEQVQQDEKIQTITTT